MSNAMKKYIKFDDGNNKVSSLSSLCALIATCK